MIASIERGETSSDVYQDPPAAPGTMADVLAGLRLATLDPAPMSAEEAAIWESMKEQYLKTAEERRAEGGDQ